MTPPALAIQPAPGKNVHRFGEHLVRAGKITREKLVRALELQEDVGGRLGTNLLELGLVHEEVLLGALGSFHKLDTVDAHKLRRVPRKILRLVPPKIAVRHRLVPVEREGNVLILASADPPSPVLEDEISMLAGCFVRTRVALELRVAGAIEALYGIEQPARLIGLARRLDHQVAARRERGQAEKSDTAASPSSASSPSSIPASLRPAPPRSKTPTNTPTRAASKPAEREARKDGEIEYIELDPESQALLETSQGAAMERATEAEVAIEPETPEDRLADAADALQSTDIRDEIGDVLLDFCAPLFKRRLLLFRRKSAVVGWRGETGDEDLPAEAMRGLEIATDAPSIFLGLQEAGSFWLGPLPGLPANQRIIELLGGEAPRDCLVLPLVLRSRIVGYLYGDNVADGVGEAPVSDLKRLVAKAGLAFEVCILKNKIRLL